MAEFEKMYHTLFRAITDALDELESSNFGAARELLIEAQQKSEEIFIEAE